jgi:hypothetical protein
MLRALGGGAAEKLVMVDNWVRRGAGEGEAVRRER